MEMQLKSMRPEEKKSSWKLRRHEARAVTHYPKITANLQFKEHYDTSQQ